VPVVAVGQALAWWLFPKLIQEYYTIFLKTC
jgi:hypothetical protein